MTKRKCNRFKRLLMAKEKEITEQMRLRREALALGREVDIMETIRATEERAMTATGLQMQTELLMRVRGALREIEEGTFGECAECGEAIELRRLEAVPWSPYCRRCQELAEGSGEEAA